MRCSPRLLIATVVAVGVIVPTAVSQTAVSAVDQDLVVSATSGAAGTEISVTSASCGTSNEGDEYGFLHVRLLAGTAPDQVLAGAALGVDQDVATVVVPDWVDPAEPAVIEAQCVSFAVTDDDDEAPLRTIFDFDPVAFDIEASPTAPVQTRTYSRTSLQAGQAFSVDASGCFLPDASQAYVDVIQGADLTFPLDAEAVTFSGASEIEGGSFSVITALVNGGVNYSSGPDDDTASIGVEEVPTDVPAGTYATVSYCTRMDGATLFYEPELIEVTGSAPLADIDLTVPAESRTATVAGGSCTVGDVDALVWGSDFEEEGDLPSNRPTGAGSGLRPTGLRTRSGVSASSALLGSRSGARSLADEPVEVISTPAPDGSWSFDEDAGFDVGIVGTYAMCGDPLEDGFLYDDQVAVVSVTEVVPTTPTTPTTTPTPAPANAVAGTPTYAG